MKQLAVFLAKLCCKSETFLEHKPSQIASACVQAALVALRKSHKSLSNSKEDQEYIVFLRRNLFNLSRKEHLNMLTNRWSGDIQQNTFLDPLKDIKCVYLSILHHLSVNKNGPDNCAAELKSRAETEHKSETNQSKQIDI